MVQLVHNHPFVRQVIHSKQRVPSVVLYLHEQIKDMLRSCCAGLLCESNVIGVDKTVNLGPLHVTLTVYKLLPVTREGIGDHLIFVGPMYLHGHSDTFSGHPSFPIWRSCSVECQVHLSFGPIMRRL